MAVFRSLPFIIISAWTTVPLKLTSFPSSSPKLLMRLSSQRPRSSFFCSLLCEPVATISDSNNSSGLIALSSMRLKSCSVLGLLVGLVGDAAEVVGLAVANPADQRLLVEAVVLVALAQLLEQFGVRRLVLVVEVVDGVDEALAEEVGPHAVDLGLAEVRVLDDEPGQLLAAGLALERHPLAALLLGGDLGAVEELGLGRQQLGVARLEEDLGVRR